MKISILLVAVLATLVKSQDYVGLVRHWVAFEYKDDVTLDKQTYFFDKLLQIQFKCLNQTTGLPYILAEEGGYSDSPEGFNKNTTQGFIFTFSSFADRDYFFTEEPVHLAYIKEITPYLGGIYMLDYQSVGVTPPSAAVLPIATSSSNGVWHHFVSFRYLPNVTEEVQTQTMTDFLQLQYLCTNPQTGNLYILSMDGGWSNGTNATDDGAQQGYVLTFGSLEDRDYFLGQPLFTPFDPHHDALKKVVRPLLSGLYAMDFSPVPDMALKKNV